MKKINKKLLGIGLIVLFFSVALIFLVKAQEGPGDFFRVDSATTTPEGAKKAAPQGQTGPAITVINRSGKSYFVPNKTPGEFDSFRNNAPKYVFVDECGDAVCGEYENKDNCPEDCNAPANLPYCGDNICNNVVVCTTTETAITIPRPAACNKTIVQWMYDLFSSAYFYVTGQQWSNICANPSTTTFVPVKTCKVEAKIDGPTETWENCPDDCKPTSNSSGCGVCGYGADGQRCPNWCNGGQLDGTNCIYVSGETQEAELYLVYGSDSKRDYLNAAHALAALDAPALPSTPSYRMVAGWTCSPSLNPCPAGKYCSPNGLASSPQINCPAGAFCPTGSWYYRICPPGTYSTGSAAKCTTCPPGTYSMHGATTADPNSATGCFPRLIANDTSCQLGEKPSNSNDCPDQFSQNPSHEVTNPNYNAANIVHSQQNEYYSDGRCSGVENSDTSSPFYSPDCFCGNGTCDNDESDASCYLDCAKGNGICDSINNPRRPLAAEGLDENHNNSNGDCYYGDGICDNSETVANHPNDCGKCGNGVCDASAPWLETNSNCSEDCKCGNGVCNSTYPWSENISNCPADCTCGNGICEPYKGEYSQGSGSCPDCHCGFENNGYKICDGSETVSNCRQDCSCGIDGNGDHDRCDSMSPYYETATNCPTDCGDGAPLPRIPYYKL